MKSISLAVSEFAVPSPLKGSIDVHSGFGRASLQGIEIHHRVQAERARSHANYQAEVRLAHVFEKGEYSLNISGRMDGFFAPIGEGLPSLVSPHIEEIKSSFNIYDLAKTLRESEGEHPYCLQLRTYGYFYWLKEKVFPRLSLHLVSTRNSETIDVEIALEKDKYEEWLSRRLVELEQEAIRAEKRAARRKKVSGQLAFPFSKPRSGQVELINTITEGMGEHRPMLIQAPTGLGKTIGVLYPSLREALSRGQRVVYVTPKNSQHSVAEEAIDRLQEQGANIKAMTLTAKSKMCFKNEPLCNPDYCEYAKDHYTKVAENKTLEALAKKRSLKAKTFKKIAEEHQVCPFEIQLDAAREMDTVICDYNYVFAPRSAFGRLAGVEFAQEGKPNLVIDEAHNLPSRAMDYYSPSLSVAVLETMREDIQKLPKRFRNEASLHLDGCISVVKSCGKGVDGRSAQIEPPTPMFLEQDASLRAFLSEYLTSEVEIQPRDVVMRLCFYWSEFTGALEFATSGRSEFFTTYSAFPPTVRITCCDASEMLKASYGDYENVVAFSATLKPFEYYRQLMGLDPEKLKTAEFVSPFPKARRKILIIPQISSKYSERERNYPRIAEAIQKIASLKPGNYFAFFPSFDFMERVHAVFTPPEGTEVLKQERGMKRDDIQNVLNLLSDRIGQHIVFAVQGGVFSEGVDYPGDMIIGAFVVGPPLPSFDLEREKMREYYQERYNAGFDYAYTFPAMAKAVQAAGRVIRSETDRGVIILMDSRFTERSYTKSMPGDWFEDSPRELVSNRILADVEEFWTSTSADR